MQIPNRLAGTSGDKSSPELHVRFHDLTVLEASQHSGYSLHQQADHCIIIVEAGDYQALLNDEEFDLQAGDAMLVQAGDWHEDRCAPGNRYIGIHFRLLLGHKPVPIFREQNDTATQILRQAWQPGDDRIDRIIATQAQANHCTPLLQDALMSEILAELLALVPVDHLAPIFRQASEDRNFVDRFFTYCRLHLNQDCDVPTLAAHMGMSKRQLSNRCRQLLGDSPARVLLGLRMEEARLLLVQGDCSVADVARQLGFSSPFHFSRSFKRLYGHPPSDVKS